MPEWIGPDPEELGLGTNDEEFEEMEATYLEKAEEFRGAVWALLADSTYNDAGWAAFYMRSDEKNRHIQPSANGGYKDMLIMVVHEENAERPTIRLITKESYKTKDGITWMVQDMMLDEDDDAYYFVDAHNHKLDREFAHTKATMFWATGNAYGIRNNHPRGTPWDEILVDDTDGEPKRRMRRGIAPFGFQWHPEDRSYALDQGLVLLDEILDNRPYAQRGRPEPL